MGVKKYVRRFIIYVCTVAFLLSAGLRLRLSSRGKRRSVGP
jgi:hypothetical protein